MPHLIEIQNLYKTYLSTAGGKITLLEDISFTLKEDEKGSIVSFLGPYKSGKSTLLKIFAGLEDFDNGKFDFNGKPAKNITGRIIYLSETPVSFPWLTVKENLDMALNLQKNGKGKPVNKVIQLIGLAGYEDFVPSNDSYGFRLRISLGRALAAGAEIILLDDCFRIMDMQTRSELYALVQNINSSEGTAFIVGTSNITEAVLLSDRILLMKKNPGRVFFDMMIDRTGKDTNTSRDEIEVLFKQENINQSLQLDI